MSITTSTGALIFFSSVIVYWGLFLSYIASVKVYENEVIIGVMFGILIPLIILKYISDKCEWDWS